MTTVRVGDRGVRLEPIDPEADLITIEAFRASVECGAFIDYDGFGEWATGTHVSDITIRPSQLARTTPPPWATHVVWYNR